MVIYNNLLSTLELPITPRSLMLTWHTRHPKVNREIVVLLPLMVQFVVAVSLLKEGSNKLDQFKGFIQWGFGG